MLCKDFLYPVHTNPSTNMEGAGRNLFTPFSKTLLQLNRFSRKARLLDIVLVQNWSTEFHEKRTN